MLSASRVLQCDCGDSRMHFLGFRGFFGEGMVVGCGFLGEIAEVMLAHFLGLYSRRVFVSFLIRRRKTWEERITLQLGDVQSEFVALFEDTFAAFRDEVVETGCELGHAVP